MRKSVKIITGFLLTAILSAAAVFASFSDRLDVVNHISVGDISISISEYARKGKRIKKKFLKAFLKMQKKQNLVT